VGGGGDDSYYIFHILRVHFKERIASAFLKPEDLMKVY
jgi:hypothetical protein